MKADKQMRFDIYKMLTLYDILLIIISNHVFFFVVVSNIVIRFTKTINSVIDSIHGY